MSGRGKGGNWKLAYWLLFVTSVAFLVGGYFASNRHFLSHLLNEFGIAGIVALALSLTIERISAAEFRQRAESERESLKSEFRSLAEEERAAIKKDVFYQAYGRMIPLDIREELDHHVLQSDFIRSELYLQFDLTVEKDPNTSVEYVKSKCRMKSTISNLSGQPRTFPIDHAIDRSPSEGLQGEVKYLEFQASGSQTDIHLNESDLTAFTRTDKGEKLLNLGTGKEVVVLPNRPTTLDVQYQGIRILEGGGIYFFFTSHTSRLELMVHVRDRNLDIFEEAYSPHKLRQTQRHDPDNGIYNWTLEKPLLCYQAIRITWNRRAASGPPRVIAN